VLRIGFELQRFSPDLVTATNSASDRNSVLHHSMNSLFVSVLNSFMANKEGIATSTLCETSVS